MILFDRCLESWLNSSQKQLSRKDAVTNHTAYFLIGSFCSDGDIHVAHTAQCPPPSTAADAAGDALSKTLDDEWIADNAEKITRVLPGGVNVVGLAWISDRKTYSEQKIMLTRALARIQRNTNMLSTLNISSIADEMALVFIEAPGSKPTGLIIDVVQRGPDSPAKVSFTGLEWVSVVSSASARICLNVPKSKQPHFFTDFVAAIRPFTENLLSCPFALVNGEIRNDSEQLFVDLKKKRPDSVELQLFIDTREDKENMCELQSATNLHEVCFDIEIRAAVPARASVGMAVAAAKQHLIRNLTARAELQYESMEVVEGSSIAPCSVHQMPRAATTVLYTHPAILLSDFLFEADTVEDAQKNFEELLGYKTSIERSQLKVMKIRTTDDHNQLTFVFRFDEHFFFVNLVSVFCYSVTCSLLLSCLQSFHYV